MESIVPVPPKITKISDKIHQIENFLKNYKLGTLNREEFSWISNEENITEVEQIEKMCTDKKTDEVEKVGKSP